MLFCYWCVYIVKDTFLSVTRLMKYMWLSKLKVLLESTTHDDNRSKMSIPLAACFSSPLNGFCSIHSFLRLGSQHRGLKTSQVDGVEPMWRWRSTGDRNQCKCESRTRSTEKWVFIYTRKGRQSWNQNKKRTEERKEPFR